MGRMVIVQFAAVAATAAQDLFEIKASSTQPLILHEVRITQYSDVGDAASEALSFTVKRFAGSYTSGSGGSSPTPALLDSADSATGVTCEANNTSRAAVGTGSLTTLLTTADNIAPGWHFLPTPECRPKCKPAEGFIIGLETAPADSLTINGYAIVEEIG